MVRAVIIRAAIGTIMAVADRRGADRASIGQILHMFDAIDLTVLSYREDITRRFVRICGYGKPSFPDRKPTLRPTPRCSGIRTSREWRQAVRRRTWIAGFVQTNSLASHRNRRFDAARILQARQCTSRCALTAGRPHSSHTLGYSSLPRMVASVSGVNAADHPQEEPFHVNPCCVSSASLRSNRP